MRTLLKRAIGATSVCVLAVGMVLGANAFTKKADSKVSEEKKAETMVTFRYEPPATDPYTEASVKDVANWKESADQCPNPTSQDVPCSLQVPESNTLGTHGTPGLTATINPSVIIQTTNVDTDQFKLAQASNAEYSNEINRSLN